MATLVSKIEAQGRRTMRPEEIFAVSSAREQALSRLLVAYVSTGLAFMLLPGTFLGVWNLISISSRQAAQSISPAWIQAHGQAQVFGWIGSFILGIGFYALPKLRRSRPFALAGAWSCWAMWTTGVALRWMTTVYGAGWRVLLPLSGGLELAAFAMFLRAVATHEPSSANKSRFEPWVLVVIAGTTGLLAALVMNLAEGLRLAAWGAGPAFPAEFDQKFLAVIAWGFMVPFVWGFSAKWLPVFLGLKPPKTWMLVGTGGLNAIAVALAVAGYTLIASVLLLAGAFLAPLALRLFEPTQQPAKTRGVHASFPYFVRSAYLWLMVAGALALWASIEANPGGIWGASRHALTVGFVAMMVFCVGQRVLPAFAGMKLLWSTRLMGCSTVLLTIGCSLRVSCEVLAYQGYAAWAWKALPVSAVIELTAVTIFAVNMGMTFRSPSTGELAKRAA
jgi:uncharacterized protein involved in response to NO